MTFLGFVIGLSRYATAGTGILGFFPDPPWPSPPQNGKRRPHGPPSFVPEQRILC